MTNGETTADMGALALHALEAARERAATNQTGVSLPWDVADAVIREFRRALGWQAIAESNREANAQACKAAWGMRAEVEVLAVLVNAYAHARNNGSYEAARDAEQMMVQAANDALARRDALSGKPTTADEHEGWEDTANGY